MKRLTSWLVLASFLTTLAAAPTFANEQGKKSTTTTLGAAAIVSMLTHHPRWATVLGVGTAYSYSQYAREHAQHQKARAYRQGYRAGQRSH